MALWRNIGGVTTIVAGPGQTLHEIEVERPGDLSHPGAVDSFHEVVRRLAGLK